jgi:Holliday junction resolvase
VDRLVATVEHALTTHRFHYRDERELQLGIDQVLRAAGLAVVREASLGASGTIDFLIAVGDPVENLGVEVKINGTRADVARQVHRYLQHDAVAALLVVSTRAGLARLPSIISGKRVFTHHLVSGAF